MISSSTRRNLRAKPSDSAQATPGLCKVPLLRYDLGMTAAKIAITLTPEQLALARDAVREGRAASVSSYIARAIDRQGREESLDTLIRDLISQHGAPTAKDNAWAKHVLRRRKKA